jgi:hypothetical protein
MRVGHALERDGAAAGRAAVLHLLTPPGARRRLELAKNWFTWEEVAAVASAPPGAPSKKNATGTLRICESGTDAVCSVFIFLNLLERQGERVG